LNPKFGINIGIGIIMSVNIINSSAINLSAIADASNPTGGFVINGEAAYDWSGFSVSHNIRFTCIRLTAWTGTPGTHNQIIQAIAVDIA
jgi:hypothetical protein